MNKPSETKLNKFLHPAVVLGCGNKILVGINPFGPVSGLAGQLIPRVACDQMTASQGKLCWTEIPHSLALEPMW